LLVVLVLAAIFACNVYPEEAVLDRFFKASRLRDKTAAAEFATVLFEPLQQGIVTTFQIRGVERDGPNRKVVTLEAPVKLPDGRVVEKTLRATMELRSGRWMITSVM
jgi:hypothetical protein